MVQTKTPAPAAAQPKPAAPPANPAPGEAFMGSWLIGHLHHADVAYQVLIVVLAFLLGSFAADNADLWNTLATGKLLANGELRFGVDPFCYTTASSGRTGVAWVDHSWLTSWLFYRLYSLGGPVLVVCKAACLAAVAFVMLWMRPANPHRWAGTLCVLLAVVAGSSQGLLQPIVVSYLFLALTLAVVHHAGLLSPQPNPQYPRLWLLPLLFALWINMDGWFFLGPLLLLLVIAGRLVESLLLRRRPRPTFSVWKPLQVLAVGMLACLANPYHVRALLSLPPEMGALLLRLGQFWPRSLVAGGTTYSLMQRLTPGSETSPFSTDTVSNVCFLLLIALTLGSFLVCKPEPGAFGARFAIALVFGLLALAQPRLVPFLAIVGGTVLAWNVQEQLALREQNAPVRRRQQELWANAARLAAGFALFGLFFLAWPGWVNSAIGDYGSPRRVAWKVEEDPSLRQLAGFLHDMHERGELTRGFNLSIDVAAYCAFHGGGLQFFQDSRLALFDRTAGLYAQIRGSLEEETETPGPFNTWRGELGRAQVDYLVGSGPLARKLMLWTMTQPRGELETIYADGKSFVLAWNRNFRKGETFAAKGLEITEQWRQEVYGPHAKPADITVPPPLVEAPGFWKVYAFGENKPPLKALQAGMLMDAQARLTAEPPWVPFSVYGALFAGTATGPLPALGSLGVFPQAARLAPFSGSELGQPAAVLLGLRLARASLAEDPYQPQTYRILAYGANQLEIIEGFWAGSERRSNLRTDIRRFQLVAAQQQVVLLAPRDFRAQWMLGQYFRNQGCFDLAAKHLEMSLKLIVPGTPGVDADVIKQKPVLESELDELRRELERRERDYEQRTLHVTDTEKIAEAAFRPYQPLDRKGFDPRGLGLVGKAWDLANQLMPQFATMSPEETQRFPEMYIHLALKTGHLWQADNMIRETKMPYELTVLNAVEGNFRQASRALADFEKFSAKDEKAMANLASHAEASAVALLAAPAFASLHGYPALYASALRSGELAIYQGGRAQYRLLHGLFALEAGDATSARRYFQQSLRIGSDERVPFPDRKIAQRYLDRMTPYFAK